MRSHGAPLANSPPGCAFGAPGDSDNARGASGHAMRARGGSGARERLDQGRLRRPLRLRASADGAGCDCDERENVGDVRSLCRGGKRRRRTQRRRRAAAGASAGGHANDDRARARSPHPTRVERCLSVRGAEGEPRTRVRETRPYDPIRARDLTTFPARGQRRRPCGGGASACAEDSHKAARRQRLRRAFRQGSRRRRARGEYFNSLLIWLDPSTGRLRSRGRPVCFWARTAKAADERARPKGNPRARYEQVLGPTLAPRQRQPPTDSGHAVINPRISG